MHRKFSLAGCLLVWLAAASAHAADASSAPPGATAALAQPGPPDLNALGDNVFTRFVNYYKLEWGVASLPADPKAPPSRRARNPPRAGIIAPDAVHRMALRRFDEPWREPAILR